ncbi:hypothetical protein [Bradyrhizobium acaciae]|uniref:hypothetical protein n=1 Tax=Bradyrhizobium acaciae TaxID=2683706 RepID=UPI001E499576|nr:hypothetical protein [Bradyrhizobium acaciae]MCC8978967.1 hypothetical protein [Bradyrhizobium acaciae]
MQVKKKLMHVKMAIIDQSQLQSPPMWKLVPPRNLHGAWSSRKAFPTAPPDCKAAGKDISDRHGRLKTTGGG